MDAINMQRVNDMLIQDEIFYGPGKERMAQALMPTVRNLPTILQDILDLKANVRTIAEARRRFIRQSQDDGAHYLAAEGNSERLRMYLDNWQIEVEKLQRLIRDLDKIKKEFNYTNEQILREQLQIDPMISVAINGYTIGDLLEYQPSAVCFNPA